MTEREILGGVLAVGRERLGWKGTVDPGARLVEDLNLDSLALLALAVEVENRFRVCLDPEDEAAIATVGDLVTVLGRKLEAAGGAS